MLISVRIREYSNGLLFLILSVIILVDCSPSWQKVTLSEIFYIPRISKKTFMTSKLYCSSSTTRIFPIRSYSLLYELDWLSLLLHEFEALFEKEPKSFFPPSRLLLRQAKFQFVSMRGTRPTLLSSVGKFKLYK